MADKRFWIGIVTTVAWLFFAVWLGYARWSELSTLPLNSLGDVFAGFFAPLAFLWLVLGFLQQGQELRLSTDALRLQADELRQSVEQQKELVAVSRQQTEASVSAIQHGLQTAVDAAQPKFVFESHYLRTYPGDDSGLMVFHVGLSNHGKTATHLHFQFEPSLHQWWIARADAFPHDFNKSGSAMIREDSDSPIRLLISYLDIEQRPFRQSFNLDITGDRRLSFVRLSLESMAEPSNR